MSPFAEKVRQMDPDRYYAALFAPAVIRDRLMVLYAFYLEAARIPEEVSEPVIGEMRLNWMKEAVEDLFADPPKVRRHDLYEALSDLVREPGGPSKEDLLQLIEARVADLGQGPFPDEAERERYIDRTAGLVMKLASQLCHGHELAQDMSSVLVSAGRYWGFTGLLAHHELLARSGRPPFTEDEISQDDPTTGLRESVSAMTDELSNSTRILPSSLYPALGYIRLGRSYLKHDGTSYSPGPLTRQISLLFGSLTGRLV